MQHEYRRRKADVLIALHAVKTAPAVADFVADHPEGRIVIGLTGTDIYPTDHSGKRQRTFEDTIRKATAIIALQSHAARSLPAWAQDKAWVIYQSAEPPKPRPRAAVNSQGPGSDGTGMQGPGSRGPSFQVAVIGHLRAVKDPFRTAMAIRRLPPESQIRVVQVGAALSESMQVRARREEERNARYGWVGAKSKSEAGRILSSSDLLVISSRSEGSSNVLGEALVRNVPVISSRIGGIEATLGPDYPGYFDVGDTSGLREQLLRAETDRAFYRSLRDGCRRARPLVSPARERRDWKRLIQSLQRDLESGLRRR